MDVKYYHIMRLYLKLSSNNHIKLELLLEKLSPTKIVDWKHGGGLFSNKHQYKIHEISEVLCDNMISEINIMQVRKGDIVLIELHEAKEKFKEE